MDRFEVDMPLGNPDAVTEPQEDRSMIDDISKTWDMVDFSYGDNVAEEARAKSFKAFPDYEKNKNYYDAYSDNTAWLKSASGEKSERAYYETALAQGKFKLDAEGNVVDGENAAP